MLLAWPDCPDIVIEEFSETKVSETKVIFITISYKIKSYNIIYQPYCSENGHSFVIQDFSHVYHCVFSKLCFLK